MRANAVDALCGRLYYPLPILVEGACSETSIKFSDWLDSSGWSSRIIPTTKITPRKHGCLRDPFQQSQGRDSMGCVRGLRLGTLPRTS